MKHYDRTYDCPQCGRTLRGNGGANHIRVCQGDDPSGNARVYPFRIDRKTYAQFKARCAELGVTVAKRLAYLIKKDNAIKREE